jgi:hypothetical protein
MTVTYVSRTECDRCGHIWEGDELGSTTIIVHKNEKGVFGALAGSAYSSYQYPRWNVLCASCSSALLPWLNVKE